jgi:hypothetical protein
MPEIRLRAVTSKRAAARAERRRVTAPRKLTLMLSHDTVRRLAVHAHLSDRTSSLAAEEILRPYLLRFGRGRTAEEFIPPTLAFESSEPTADVIEADPIARVEPAA